MYEIEFVQLSFIPSELSVCLADSIGLLSIFMPCYIEIRLGMRLYK